MRRCGSAKKAADDSYADAQTISHCRDYTGLAGVLMRMEEALYEEYRGIRLQQKLTQVLLFHPQFQERRM